MYSVCLFTSLLLVTVQSASLDALNNLYVTPGSDSHGQDENVLRGFDAHGQEFHSSNGQNLINPTSASSQSFRGDRNLNQDFNGAGNGLFGGAVGRNGAIGGNLPQYEDHTIDRLRDVPQTFTITSEVTKTHTLRVPSTSDVWVTDVTMVKIPVSVVTTQRSYRPDAPDTVTSFVRVTQTSIDVATRTVEAYPTKTLLSVFTQFVTETATVELWHPIVHMTTINEIITHPVVETQTLVQHIYTTVTRFNTVDVTKYRGEQF